jgi:hypothetical protein
MITAQAASESTPTQKIATRGESRSVRLLSGAAVATAVKISAYGSLGIFRSLPANCTGTRPVLMQGPAAGGPGAGGGSPGRLTLDVDLAVTNRHRGWENGSPDDRDVLNIGWIARRPE